MTCAKINEPLRMTKEYPKVQCHSDKLTDMAFVPYYSNYLATGSLNSEISLWRLPEDINEIPALKPITVLNSKNFFFFVHHKLKKPDIFYRTLEKN